MKKQHISEAVIRRLPRYYRYLDDLHNKGVIRISSNSLGSKMGITASQIRQDLSCFGEFGQQGYGYNVKELRGEIGRILGIDKKHTIIIVGVGNLGHALMQNFHFAQNGFSLEAAFDVSPALIGSEINGVLVRDLSELDSYCRASQVGAGSSGGSRLSFCRTRDRSTPFTRPADRGFLEPFRARSTASLTAAWSGTLSRNNT